MYLQKIFEGKDVEISRLSYGIPMGAEIDYLDDMTLDRALNDRKKIS
jgi:recombination protein RecR